MKRDFIKAFLFLSPLSLFCITFTSFSACKSRSFNANNSQTQSAPSDPFFATENQFKKAYFESAKKSLSIFSAEDLSQFFSPDQIDALKKNQFENFYLFLQVPFSWAVEHGSFENVWLSLNGGGSIPTGGLILINRDLFPEGYYRGVGSKVPLSDLMTKAPWFAWDATRKSWEPRKEGSQKRLLEFFSAAHKDDETLTLYRGATLPSAATSLAPLDPYASGKPQAGQLWFFASPSINTAISGASPSVLKADFTKSELLSAATGPKPTMYVGIEYDSLEFAFLQSNTEPQLFAKGGRAKPYCIVEGKYKDENHGLTPGTKDFAVITTALEKAVEAGTPFCDSKIISGFISGLTDNPVFAKTAWFKKAGLVKSFPFPDSEKQEGVIVCSVPEETSFEFVESASASQGQTWMRLASLPRDFGCPNAFRSKNIYVDSEKIVIGEMPVEE